MYQLPRILLGFIIAIPVFSIPSTAFATDLLEVYQQAQMNDPTYQEAIANRLAVKEEVPISIAALLPNLSASAIPNVTRSSTSGSALATNINGEPASPRNVTQRAYTLSLTATQTVFDFARFARIAGAVSTSKGADATLNTAVQDLILRVAKAYLAILEDEDNLSFNEASKRAYAEQLKQAKQQYEVGLKTITDVYTAEARYDSSVANYIAAETKLANDKENLRVITGMDYSHLAKLSENFPLITPTPANVETWVQIAQQQNWAIKAAQYNVSASLQTIRQQYAGHLPTINLQGSIQRQYQNNLNDYNSINMRNGPSTYTNKEVLMNINVPLFAGGAVIAQTHQASYHYQAAQQQLEKTIRDTINATRQYYLNVISGISQLTADKQAIKSNISSLEGMEASYNVGTETLVNVLNQQETLFQSQTKYASDRYAFVNNVLALKKAAGTLSFDDLRAINAWLSDEIKTNATPSPIHTTGYYKPKTFKPKKAIAGIKHKAKTAHAKLVSAKAASPDRNPTSRF